MEQKQKPRNSATVGIDKDLKRELVILAGLQTAKEGKYVSARELINRAVKDLIKKAKG